MTANEILSELARRGVSLEVIGDKLRWRPKDAVTEKLLEALKLVKREIIAVLSRGRPHGPGQCPGPTRWGGCYEVAPGIRMHPPKASEDWNAWFEKWQPDGRDRLQ